MPPMLSTPKMIQMKNGPQNAYMPLHAMPSAVPHMELPLYQNENAGMAKNPEIRKNSSAGLVAAALDTAPRSSMPPPNTMSSGNTTKSSSTPAVT